MALAESILAAVSAVSGTITSFVSKGMQNKSYTKGVEVEGIGIERQKTLAAYQGIAANRQTIMLLIIGLTLMIVLLIIFKK